MDEIGGAVTNADAVLFPMLSKHLHYEFGHPLEIVQTLQEMTTSPTKQALKYPLVALFTDILVNNDNVPDGWYGDAAITIIIATMTTNTDKAAQRLEKNFKPILQPIKMELLKQISLIKQFSTGAGELKYKEIEHYYWGKEGLYGREGNIFNDYIDAIELRDVKIRIKPKICQTIKNSL